METLKLTSSAEYVNNGINTPELNQLLERAEVKTHPLTVFTLGRICYQKNPSLFNAIAEAMPKVQFLWIGDGELRNQLTAPNIEVTGWSEREDALTLAANADVFLLTSLWEGLPISLLESMYMKKLCVVSDVIGNHDVIYNGENGFVCRTVEEFRTAIETPHPDGLIHYAYHDVLTKYNTFVMAEKYSEIYRRYL